MRITLKQSKRIGEKLGVNWDKVDIFELRMGIQEEAEHTSVVGRSMTAWAKVALAHLKENKFYYSKLKRAMK
jgi:hypothetical protein